MSALGRLLPFLTGVLCVAAANWQSPSDEKVKAGLALWRTPDRQGRACASCHSPDGIDLAAYAYDEATMRRRAGPHLGIEAAGRLAAYIVDLRRKLHLKGELDPMVDRPMQPGGAVLPGKTPEERDGAFAASLRKLLPTLSAERVGTIAEAKAALAEVMKLDPAEMRIGIQGNRLSEDKFHGMEHASLAHWIPDQPPLPNFEALEQAQQRYLTEPSQENLRGLDSLYASQWSRQLLPLQAISLQKARALLVYQHLLRTKTGLRGHLAMPDPAKAPTNPFWEVGDLARIYTNSQPAGLSIPPDVAANKSGGPNLAAQMREIRLPWLWLGWTLDPGLQRTSLDPRVRYADWFAELLLEDGPYPAHAAFMLTKKLATVAYDKEAWASASPQHLVLNFSWLLRGDNWRNYAPKDVRRRKTFFHFLSNSFRMFTLLQGDEILETGVVYLREPLIQQLTSMKKACAAMEPGSAKQDAALFDRIIQEVTGAKSAPG